MHTEDAKTRDEKTGNLYTEERGGSGVVHSPSQQVCPCHTPHSERQWQSYSAPP